MPLACNSSLTNALCIRALIGFFESASFPALYHFYPIWIPSVEKTLMVPLIVSGMYLGEIIGFSLSGILVKSEMYINGVNYGGWPSIFYVFGCLGLIWFPCWVFLAHESPTLHPTISKEELAYMLAGTYYNTIYMQIKSGLN